jgi:hypothetical protein
MRIGSGKRSGQRKPAPVPLCPPQIPHDNLGSNLGRHGGKPATNRLSYDVGEAPSYFSTAVGSTHIPNYFVSSSVNVAVASLLFVSASMLRSFLPARLLDVTRLALYALLY